MIIECIGGLVIFCDSCLHLCGYVVLKLYDIDTCLLNVFRGSMHDVLNYEAL